MAGKPEQGLGVSLGTVEIDGIRWVADMLGSDDADRIVAEPPSPRARALLDWATKNQNVFWKDIYPEILPSKQEIERASRRKSEMHEDEALVEKVLKAARARAGRK